MRLVVIGLAALFAVVLGSQAPASAAVIFSDSFDAEGPPGVSILNYTAFANWNVVGFPVRSVDLISQGGFGIGCAGGGGKCVDMDGTTSQAGRLVSKTTFTLDPGAYQLRFAFSGNQRNGPPDSMSFGFGTVVTQTIMGIPSGQPFTTVILPFTLLATTSGNIFFDHAGGDQLGIILDDVVLESGDINEVPEPATFVLVGVGLVAAAGLRLRRRLRR